MIESLTPACGANGCDPPLEADNGRLVSESPGGTRHVSECWSGAVTITVHR